jgi:hypothetical protein
MGMHAKLGMADGRTTTTSPVLITMPRPRPMLSTRYVIRPDIPDVRSKVMEKIGPMMSTMRMVRVLRVPWSRLTVRIVRLLDVCKCLSADPDFGANDIG